MTRSRSLSAVLPLLAAAALGCRTARPAATGPDVPPAPMDARAPRVALVLGGGSARGFAHVGVISALEEAGIPIELVVGTSVGSLVGGLYASGIGGRALEETARDLERDDFFDFNLWTAVSGLGLAPGRRLEAFVREKAGDRAIEALPRPFIAVAVDVMTGEQVVIDSGPLTAAIRASTAIPGVFEPFERGDRLLVDGGVRNNLPVRLARERGADVVIAVDVSSAPSAVPLENAIDVLLRSIEIMFDENAEDQTGAADVVVRPDVSRIAPLDFGKRREAIEAGRKATRALVPIIEEKLRAARAPRRAARGAPAG